MAIITSTGRWSNGIIDERGRIVFADGLDERGNPVEGLSAQQPPTVTTVALTSTSKSTSASTANVTVTQNNVPVALSSGSNYLAMGETSTDALTIPAISAGVKYIQIDMYVASVNNGYLFDLRTGVSRYFAGSANNIPSASFFTVDGATQPVAWSSLQTGRHTVKMSFDTTATYNTAITVFNRYSVLSGSAFAANVYDIKVFDASNNVIAHYDMSLGTVTDQSGHGNSATLTGGTWVTSQPKSNSSSTATPTLTVNNVPVAVSSTVKSRSYATATATVSSQGSVISTVKSHSTSTATLTVRTALASTVKSHSNSSQSLVKTTPISSSVKSNSASHAVVADSIGASLLYSTTRSTSRASSATLKKTINLIATVSSRSSSSVTTKHSINLIAVTHSTSSTVTNLSMVGAPNIHNTVKLVGTRKLHENLNGSRQLNETLSGSRKLHESIVGEV